MSVRAYRWSSSLVKARPTQKNSLCLASRQYSSIPSRNRNPSSFTSGLISDCGGKHISKLSSRHHTLQSLSDLPTPTTSIRFASTTADPQSTLIAEPVLDPPPSVISETLPNEQQLLDLTSGPLDIGRHVGFLKELGLDFGWGPTSTVQWVLEHVHVYAGTPWWASIPLTLLAIRVVLFKTYIGSADVSARLLIIKPHMQDIRERLDEAKKAQDMPEVMRQSQEMKNIYSAAGIKIWKSFLPFLNIPLGYGFFRITRNMAALPAPGLDEAGALWFTDLTMSDPFFILPMATGVATFYLFKAGGELGSTAAISTTMMRTFQWGMPIMSTVFMSFWPAALQLGFFTTSLMALTQANLFKQAWFRNLCNIHPLPPKETPPREQETRYGYKGMVVPTTAREVPQQPEVLPAGVFGNARSKFTATVSDLQKRGQKFVQSKMDTNKGTTASRRSAAEISEAKRYDEKRRKEIQQARMHSPNRRYTRR